MSSPKDAGGNLPQRSSRGQPPTPKPFHITEPFFDRGLWCFWLTADDEVLEFISHLPCILQPMLSSPFQRRLRGRVMFSFNPRYDHEEAWLWIHELLDTETNFIELNDSWEEAIRYAYGDSGHSDDNLFE